MESVNPSSMNRDLLGDLDEIVVLNYASKGQRFGSYFIDSIIVYIINLGLTSGLLYLSYDDDGGALFSGWLSYLFSYAMYVAYYTLMEGFVQGRTIGKMITGTYAIGNNSQPLTLQQAFLRSLCRIVPFEPFSALGAAPWHDKWTDTTVVIRNK